VDVASYPVNVLLLGAVAVVKRSQSLPDLIEQTRALRIHAEIHTGCIDAYLRPWSIKTMHLASAPTAYFPEVWHFITALLRPT
jgi:hypothetical protein